MRRTPPVPDGRLHHGAAHGRGQAHARARGQVFGTQIPHALTATSTAVSLAIAVIEAAFLGATMPATSVPHDSPTRLAPAGPRAILLPAVAEPADGPDPLAKRTDEQPMIRHALARADLLALALVPGEGAAVDAPSRDTEGRELALLAFVLSALADVSYRPGRQATKFPASRTSSSDHADRSGR